MKHILSPLFRTTIPRNEIQHSVISSFDEIIEKVFNDTFPELSKDLGNHIITRGAYPRVDIIDNKDTVVIEAEIPGLTKEDVKIEIIDNSLIIKGNKREQKSDQKNNYIKREIKRSNFERYFKLCPEIIDTNKVSAKFENGSLFITLNKIKKEEPKPNIKTVNID